MAIIENAVTLLKTDHLTVSALFKALKAADALDIAGRETLFNKIKQELDAHAYIEEHIFYPAVQEASAVSGTTVEHAFHDHQKIKDLLSELAVEKSSTPEWTAKLHLLENEVQDHVEEEESDMLPQTEKILGVDKLRELGRRMTEEKEKYKQMYA